VTPRTPQVRCARAGTGSVTPSSARDPGVARGENPRPGLGMTLHRHPEQREGSRRCQSRESPPWAWNDSPSSSRAIARDLRAARCRDSSPSARNDNSDVAARNDKSGVAARNETVGALSCGKTKPNRAAMTLICHPERTRGISALRGAEIPRLGLGMTPHRHPEQTRGISALRAVQIPRLRLGMTKAAIRLGMTGAALRLGMTKATNASARRSVASRRFVMLDKC
jgi:hypothetical protein